MFMMEERTKKHQFHIITISFLHRFGKRIKHQQLMSVRKKEKRNGRGVKQVASNLFTSVPFSCLFRLISSKNEGSRKVILLAR